jgi:HflK protein
VIKPQVTNVITTEVGFRTVESVRTSRQTDVIEESLMLTGDENIVDVDVIVQWQIDPVAPENYVFNIQDPPGTVKAVAESAMREVVGRRNIQPVLTTDRGAIETEVRQLMQETLDTYKAGVQIRLVQMQKVDPPQQVIDAFRDVQAARADQERLRNEAQTYANRVVPEARGRSAQLVQAAEAYKDQTVAEALGQASRFNAVYEQYKNAPGVTRERLFIETMERVLGGADKVIIDQKNGSQGVVPYLPLNELQQRRVRRRRSAGGRSPMNGSILRVGALVIVAIAAVLLYAGTFVIQQTQSAIVLRFGAVRTVATAPGLYFKLPAPFETGDLPRQPHPRSRPAVAGNHRLGPEAARCRCLHALPDLRSAALLSGGQQHPARQFAACLDRQRQCPQRARRGLASPRWSAPTVRA